MPPIIETFSLTKAYDRQAGWRRRPGLTAVDGVTLRIETGELYGLLGPNGAGKTTLVKMLATLILPSAGAAVVAGHALDEANGPAIRAILGLVTTDERSFYWRLSARQNLRFFAALHNLHGPAAAARVEWALAATGLTGVAGERFGNLSSGLRQRLAIGRSLLHGPRLLILDEPSRSLDPTAAAQLHGLIRRLMAEQALSVLLITHDLGEAEALCDRVALMDRGRVRAIGRPADLRRELGSRRSYTVTAAPLPPAAVDAARAAAPGLAVAASAPAGLIFQAEEEDGRLDAVLAALHAHGAIVRAIDAVRPTLEEVFAHYTSPGEPPPPTQRHL